LSAAEPADWADRGPTEGVRGTSLRGAGRAQVLGGRSQWSSQMAHGFASAVVDWGSVLFNAGLLAGVSSHRHV